MMDNQPLPFGDEFMLLCGPCHDDDGQRKVLAKVSMFGPARPGEPEPWLIAVRLPSRVHRSDQDIDTLMVLGEDHRWLQQPWAMEGYPLEFAGCGRHRIQRSRSKLAKAIKRALAAGERSLYITG